MRRWRVAGVMAVSATVAAVAVLASGSAPEPGGGVGPSTDTGAGGAPASEPGVGHGSEGTVEGRAVVRAALRAGHADTEPTSAGFEAGRIAGDDRVATAAALSAAAFERADAVLVARADDFADALVGGPLAVRLGGPILLTPTEHLAGATARELERLQPAEVVLLGGEAALSAAVERELRERYAVTRLSGADRVGTAAAVAARMPAPAGAFVATAGSFPDALAAAPLAAFSGWPILLSAPDDLPEATRAALEAMDPTETVILGGTAAVSDGVAGELAGIGGTVRRIAGDTRYHTAAAVFDAAVEAGMDPARMWLATARDFPDALAAGPVVGALGHTLLLVDGADLCAAGPAVERLRARRPEEVRLLGGPAAITADALDQLAEASDADRSCARLPRGGTRILPDHRVVAYYGSAVTPRMGVLGVGSPDEAAAALLEQAEAYEAGDRPVLPAFEFIATIANAYPGDDGLYRSVTDEASIRRYLAAARRIRALLVIDVQPGRSDFLTEVRRYEPLLLEPDVGIALDPEWRMPPGQVPGRQVGTVDASEINEVSAYVADLVERRDLPEKLFLIHQFRTSMVTDRDQVIERDGLATVFHADGFGSKGAKLGTYAAVGAEPPFFNGFKLFYAQDHGLFTPEEILELTPVPDFVSYQ